MQLRPGDEFIEFPSERQARQWFRDGGVLGYIRGKLLPLEWIPASRSGDTSVGHTLETALGIRENNRRAPDLLGYEVKASASDGSGICLFSRNPTAPDNCVQDLLQDYGYFGRNGDHTRRLGTNLTVNRRQRLGDSYLTLACNDAAARLEVRSDRPAPLGWWTYSDLLDCAGKLVKLLFFPAEARRPKAAPAEFRFPVCHVHHGFDPNAFAAGLKTGMISVHFRSKLTPGAAGDVFKNHGVAFKIDRDHVRRLYASSTVCHVAG